MINVMEKCEAGKWRVGTVILDSMIREGLIKKVNVRGDGASYMEAWGKNTPGRGTDCKKSPERQHAWPV